MKLLRSLSIRVLLVSVLSGGVGLTSAALSARYASERMATKVMGSWLRRSSARHRERCEAQPEQWSAGLLDGPQIFAYDAGTLASANGAAPPLDRALHARLGAVDGPAVADFRALLLGGGGLAQIRAAESGPCAVLQAVWPARSPESGVLLVGLAGVLGAALAAAALGVFLVVRPLSDRVRRLHGAAARVGDPRGYTPARRADDDELDRVGAALDRAHARIREDAARLERRRRDLELHLSDVAHDLRTPLASLQLAIEQAADVARDPAQVELFAGALRDCVYLAGLVSNLRLAAELEEGLDPAANEGGTDLSDAVERVVARLAALARRRGIALAHAVPDEAVLIRCHPVACEQAVGNVVENAVSYGDRGGHVAVVLKLEPEGGFCLTVADDGPGVLPAEIPRLGERTFRSDEARRRDPRGSGLGLAITGEVCRRCGFELSFAAEAPRGLRVRMRGARKEASRARGA
ncbi:HAMP domain-containing sensor histidine kinase [Sorangium sp. So ce295]|uniref:sensor histidine kinase n=1 Tax=Sorangium sp. So ce295 TaxID=3133295 RepID=UPI003F5D76DC